MLCRFCSPDCHIVKTREIVAGDKRKALQTDITSLIECSINLFRVDSRFVSNGKNWETHNRAIVQ